jgi:hypothetical protein
MLIEIQDKIISTEVFKKKFVCDLSACKGACCVEGDQGAPITKDEALLIEKEIDKIKPYMREEGISAIHEHGIAYIDPYGQPATTLVNNRECAFVYFDSGVAKCAIEKAHRLQETTVNKPLSCHLYPIRIKKFKDYTAINVEEWHICEPACACGEELNVPVFRFLKEPLERAFGKEFYQELIDISKEMHQLEN